MNDPLDQKLSTHFQARKATPLPGRDFSACVLAALPPAAPAAPLPSHPVRLLQRVLAWDYALIAVSIGLALVAGLPSLREQLPGLDAVENAMTSVESWPAFPSLALALGLTVATAFLFSSDEEEGEDDVGSGTSAWF